MLLSDLASVELFAHQYLRVPVFYVVPDPNWALGLENILPRYSVVCADMSPTVTYLESKGIRVFCAERDIEDLSVGFKRSSSSLLRLPQAQTFIREVSRGDQPQILVFKTSPAAEKAALELGCHLLAVDSRLNRRFEDKISILSELEDLGQGAIPSHIGRVADMTYEHLQRVVGDRFVIQFSRGFAGNSTVFIHTADDYHEFARHNQERRIKCSKLIEGPSLTINACVTGTGILYSHYFYQIIGEGDYNRFPGGTCGNDYAFDYGFSVTTDDQIRSMVQSMGAYMQKQRYRGIFGLDMIVENSSGQVYIIENNARLIASIPVFTRLQLMESEIPMTFLHLLEHLHLPYEIDADRYNEQNWHYRKAGQLNIRNTSAEELVISSGPESGVYGSDGSFVRKGCTLQDLEAEEEFIVLSSGSARRVGSNIEYAQLQLKCGIMQSDHVMDPMVKALAQRVKTQFKTKAALS